MCSGAFGYLEEVKERLRNPDEFQEFLKYLHIYSKENMKKSYFKIIANFKMILMQIIFNKKNHCKI